MALGGRPQTIGERRDVPAARLGAIDHGGHFPLSEVRCTVHLRIVWHLEPRREKALGVTSRNRADDHRRFQRLLQNRHQLFARVSVDHDRITFPDPSRVLRTTLTAQHARRDAALVRRGVPAIPAFTLVRPLHRRRLPANQSRFSTQ